MDKNYKLIDDESSPKTHPAFKKSDEEKNYDVIKINSADFSPKDLKKEDKFP